MARKVVVEMQDDLDGSEASQTATFALNGVTYEIDLSDKNAAKLEKALAPFIEAGRRVGGRKKSTGGNSGVDAGYVRVCALENGYEVSTRGRIPANVLEAYKAAANG